MKTSIREDSTNYACTVVKLPTKQNVTGLDNLKRVTVFGNDCLVGKDAPEGELNLFFPAEAALDKEFLSSNNLFRSNLANFDTTKTGYFELTGRVKAVKFKGVISTGFVIPISSLDSIEGIDSSKLKEGDEFTDINGINICKKYKVIRTQSTTTKESRYNKKLKRFDKLIPNQFRFHVDTSQLAKNLHVFEPDQIICITDKWHGTSAVFSNVLIRKELTLKEKIAKFLGIDVVGVRYDRLYSSRSVVKNQYINKEATAGYYNEDIWATVNRELGDKIEQGITLYGEIVGYLASGREIQKGYDYACSPGMVGNNQDSNLIASSTDQPEHKFLVYRITYTKPDGSVIEFSWQQVKDYCKKYSIEHVKELYFGKVETITTDTFREAWLEHLMRFYLEKDCVHCVNKVPAEGVVVRIDGRESYSAYKLKSKRFFERESKMLDAEVEDIEEEQKQEENV